nr:hypothetical protein [Treponema sp.]
TSKDIVKPFIEEKKLLLKSIISEVYTKKRNERIYLLKTSLFKDFSIIPLKNYNEEFSERLIAAKSPSAYTLCDQMMYLHNFIVSGISSYISSFIDIFGVRAVDTDNKYTSQMTSEFHTVMELDAQIIRLDNQLGPSFPRGYKIIGLLENKGQQEVLSKLETEVNTVNAEFNKILSQALMLFKLLDDKLKSLLLDANASTHALVKNWKDLDQYFTKPVIPSLTDISNAINDFVSLIDCYN